MDWKDQILGAAFDWEGAPVDPVTGTCTDEGGMAIPDCWNDGSSGVIYDDTDAQSGMVFINRGDGELKGIELEATWRATDNLNVRGTLTLMDNIYARNCDQEPVDDMGYTPTATIADDGVLFDCYDVSGNKIEQAADQHYSLSATYRAPLGGGGWEWMGRLGLRHEGDQFIELANLTGAAGVTTATGSVGSTTITGRSSSSVTTSPTRTPRGELRVCATTARSGGARPGTTTICSGYLESSG